MKNSLLNKIIYLLLLVLFLPITTLGAELQVAGWMPYWKFEESMRDARSHLRQLDSVYPFAYSTQSDGTIKDLADLKSRSALRFFKSADSQNVEVIPTVMWSRGAEIHNTLSNGELRRAYVKRIYDLVRKNKFDGIDIDFESKQSQTKDYYSIFLKELKEKLGSKILSCTIEARTPPDSLYRVVPVNLEYANDFDEINEHCDRVQIMAYDQQRADIKLNSVKMGLPYAPVSDVDWVRKVLTLTIQKIDKEKIMLGVPTYGHEYEVTAMPEQYTGYKKLWALNPVYAEDMAKALKIKPSRDRGGELSFSYFATSSPFQVLNALPAPRGTLSGDEVSAKALLFANATKMPVTFNVIILSDAGAIKQKVDLAKEMGLRGIAMFKIDNGEDKDMWDLFE